MKFVILLAILACLCTISTPIQCYTCGPNSGVEGVCDSDNIGEKKTCEETGVCMIKHSTNNKDQWMRTCGESSHPTGCKESNGTTEFFCDVDLCNGKFSTCSGALDTPLGSTILLSLSSFILNLIM
ncbi:uncharacterized protein LOC111696312 [Eurytemora carolleeae]|uniref:uncharacterized protein LOC111696312 n=1 Tax=Eurytemora carolleeae TaxID=1294199 RepID=UPI000C77DCD5|nr:uncharacterized protein LOC111696312 [Eurytemora carolleeae]XP_023321651.1 uncharacterized protein LOC111696312 [Eurytemora carolleeae]|eukprot:XP_023321650.1 uncharacterized protein LOC111696312 [Eurytemora affinis]